VRRRGISLSADPSAKLVIRRRQEEIALWKWDCVFVTTPLPICDLLSVCNKMRCTT
jgi:hypothetical protein